MPAAEVKKQNWSHGDLFGKHGEGNTQKKTFELGPQVKKDPSKSDGVGDSRPRESTEERYRKKSIFFTFYLIIKIL